MGYIYKITNNLNGKVYIGQTIKTVEHRFKQHINNSNKEYFSQIVLYKAFNKYGVENFSCEQIEEAPNDLLDEREKYWINYYDSYFSGYNSTLGGRTVTLYAWDEDDIIEKYHQLKSARAVARELGCDHSTIDDILNKNGVRRYTQAEQKARTIVFKKEDEEHIFSNSTEAAKWLIDNKITKMTDAKLVRQEITSRIRNNKTYFKYKVFYLDGE